MVHLQRLNRIWRCRMAPGIAGWCPWCCQMPLALPDSGVLPAGMGRARRPLALSCRISACDLALLGGPGVAGWRSPCPPPPKIFKQGLGQERVKIAYMCCKYGCKFRFATLRDVSIVVANRVGQRCKFGGPRRSWLLSKNFWRLLA